MKIRPLRRGLGHGCRVGTRLGALPLLRDRARERKRLLPGRGRAQGHHDVKALASCRLHEALEAELVEPIAQGPRAGDHAVPADGGIRIEIEDHAVGPLDGVGQGVPGVDLQDAHLHERDEAGEVVHHEVLADLRLLLDLHATQGFRRPHPAVLHVEAALLRALRAAHQRERPALHVGKDPLRDGFVEEREVALGDALRGIEHAVGMGQAHARHLLLAARLRPPLRAELRAFRRSLARGPLRGRAGLLGGCHLRDGTRLLAHDVFRVLVRAQALERRMAEPPVATSIP